MATKTSRAPKSTKTTVKPRPKAKVVVNQKQGRVGRILSSKWALLVVVLVFVGIGVGTLLWTRAATTTSTLWSDTTVPTTISSSDTKATELGVKFKSAYAGQVLGLRFYKGPQNTGTHIGHLWNNSGKELARVTFTGETASGWQTAYFSAPVNITANTTYRVSYFAPKGYYSVNTRYFRTAYTSSDGVLTAPKGAGTFIHSATTAFPTQTNLNSNYWVDPLVSTSRFTPSPKPLAPTGLTATVSESIVHLSWVASASTGISQYKVYRDGSAIATVDGATTTYADTAVTVGTTYSYQVQAIDSNNVASDLSVSASAQVTAPTPTPTPVGGCALPKYPTPTCTGTPPGTGLTVVNGDYAARTDGETINAKNITGNLYILANNVTVTNSEIDGTIYNDGTYVSNGTLHGAFTVTDTTVGPATGCIGQPGINDSNYIATRVHIRNHDDGFRVGPPGNVKIYDSYEQNCYLPPSLAPPDGSHSDGVQAVCAGTSCPGVIVQHSTFDGTKVPTTNMLNLTDPSLANVTATDNLLAGGAYVIDSWWHSGSTWTFTNNRIVNNSWAYGAVSAENTCSHQNWSGNTLVAIDDNYNILSTVANQPCIE